MKKTFLLLTLLVTLTATVAGCTASTQQQVSVYAGPTIIGPL
jgi:hypothetical protein